MVDPSNMQVTGLGAALAPILAQEQVAVGAQLEYFQSVVLSPAGITGAVLGIVFLGVALSLPQRLLVLSGTTMFFLTMMLHESTAARNVLVGPLQFVRNISRPIAFALIGVTALVALTTPRGERTRLIPATAWLFWVFQVFYALQYAVFIDGLKGLLALVSMSCMLFVCTEGFGREMQGAAGVRRTMEVYLWVGVAFVAANLVQLVLGPSAAVISGRLAGIAGNAQQLGAVCALLLLANAYLFNAMPAGRPGRWAALAVVALLALFIIWSGSRTSALTVAAGLAFMYRLQLGRFAILAFAGGAILVVASLFFEDSTANAVRFVEGGNTRAGVFGVALDDFASSPVFGIMPTGIESGVESTYLRALASMGMVGGMVMLVPFASLGIDMLRVARLDADDDRELAALRDFFIGICVALFVVNAFEGFAFGVLTFPTMFMYSVFAIGAFLLDPQAASAAVVSREDGGDLRLQARAG